MAKIKGAIVVDTERCKGCNLCVVACPLDVIALNKEVNMKGYNYAWQVKEDTCNGCSSCATVCPDGCISVYKVKVEYNGKLYSITIDLEMIGKDENFEGEADVKEKADRVICLLDAIENLSLVVKGNLDNAEPIFAVVE